jgi:AbrB family looped-hinge helix DNA binding protein
MKSTISSKGQITIPVNVRRKLGLTPGTRIELELGPEGTFLGRKSTKESFFAQFQGMAAEEKVPFGDSREAMETLRGKVAPGDVD